MSTCQNSPSHAIQSINIIGFEKSLTKVTFIRFVVVAKSFQEVKIRCYIRYRTTTLTTREKVSISTIVHGLKKIKKKL